MRRLTGLVGRRLALLLGAMLLGLLLPLGPATGQAQVLPNCSAAFLINVRLDNGASWAMCWEERPLEGIALNRIYFTPAFPAFGPQRLILWEANLAQIHVPYDQNQARFFDVSDTGLGGESLINLTQAECPGGTLRANGLRRVLCQTVGQHGYAVRTSPLTTNVKRQASALTLFSVSAVGGYSYINRWRFWDDGTIEPAVGATGSLQICTDHPRYGWRIDGDKCLRGASHTHNYTWRLDVDLGGTANNKLEEIDFAGSGTSTREMWINNNLPPFDKETARQVDPLKFRFWRIVNTAITNPDGHWISYQIDPAPRETFRGPAHEPWTANDLYFTNYRFCERLAADNPPGPGGTCATNMAGYVNGETVADAVLWYGLTFHHVARDEDEPHMNAHWSSFQLSPRDLSARNPG
jgi:primary-amine oxidase